MAIDRHKLPEGWRWQRLVSLGKLKNGGTPPKANPEYWQQGEIPFVTAADLTSLYVTSGRTHISEEGLASGKTAVCEPGDILIATRTRVGKCSIAGCRLAISQDVTRLRPAGSRFDSEYICLYLRHVGSTIAFYSQGSSIQGITRKLLKSVEIPFPRLPKQRRIAARIQEVMSLSDKALRLQNEAIEKADTLIPAALSDVFSTAQEWDIRSVSEICGKPQYGFTESAVHQAVGPKFLRITDIQNGKVDWRSVPYCRCADVDKYRLHVGDILFARTGATTGKSYIVDICPEAVFASYLIRLRAGPDVSPRYLWWYFQSSDYWAQVFGGIDVGAQPNMNGKKLSSLRIPIPSLAQQDQVATKMDSIQAKVSDLMQEQEGTRSQLDKVMPSVLYKAFLGEI